jgi:hypothetical protein
VARIPLRAIPQALSVQLPGASIRHTVSVQFDTDSREAFSEIDRPFDSFYT